MPSDIYDHSSISLCCLESGLMKVNHISKNLLKWVLTDSVLGQQTVVKWDFLLMSV